MKRRWNGMDVLLLILAVGILSGGVWLAVRRPWSGQAGEVLICTLRLEPTPGNVGDVLPEPAVGDAVRTPAGGETIGRVLSVSVSPYRILTADGDGLRFAADGERMSTEVTVRLILTDRTCGGRRLAAGGTADLMLGERFCAGCEILELEVADGAE